MIYADNAASSPLSQAALQAILPWLQHEYANASQPYSLARKSRKMLAEARENIAACVGANPDEIFFTSGGTESDNWAVKGPTVFGSCRAVITSTIEHHAVLQSCEICAKVGCQVYFLPVDNLGRISESALAKVLSQKRGTALVSCMLANNEIGTIEPIAELCSLAHQYGAVFHTDAVQAVGHIKVNVKELGVDFMSASAHKFNGPKGIGFLYVRRGTELPAYITGGAQEGGLRAGTENIAYVAGMAAALAENCQNLVEHQTKLRLLENRLLSVLNKANVKYKRNGDSCGLPGLISLSFQGCNGEAMLHRLDLKGISVSTGAACNSKSTEISHVLQAIKLDKDWAKGTIRISLGRYNSEEDAEHIAESLIKMLA
ncbi:MAG: cysteine desulfurase family protein [Candidatus Bruticola sp.]